MFTKNLNKEVLMATTTSPLSTNLRRVTDTYLENFEPLTKQAETLGQYRERWGISSALGIFASNDHLAQSTQNHQELELLVKKVKDLHAQVKEALNSIPNPDLDKHQLNILDSLASHAETLGAQQELLPQVKTVFKVATNKLATLSSYLEGRLATATHHHNTFCKTHYDRQENSTYLQSIQSLAGMNPYHQKAMRENQKAEEKTDRQSLVGSPKEEAQQDAESVLDELQKIHQDLMQFHERLYGASEKQTETAKPSAPKKSDQNPQEEKTPEPTLTNPLSPPSPVQEKGKEEDPMPSTSPKPHTPETAAKSWTDIVKDTPKQEVRSLPQQRKRKGKGKTKTDGQ